MMHLSHVLKKAYAFALFTLLLGAAGTANVFAQRATFVDGTFTYEVNPDGHSVTITGHDPAFTPNLDNNHYGIGIQNEVTDGNTGQNYRITAIGYRAFKNNDQLSSVEFLWESNILSIGAEAFMDCNELHIFDFASMYHLETIGASAFQDCPQLNTVDFCHLSDLTTIGASAFEGCYRLTYLNFSYLGRSEDYSAAHLTTIGTRAFYGCSGLRGNLDLPAAVSSIGEDAFRDCGFNGYIILNSTATGMLGSNAFAGCNNISGVISNSVTPPGHVNGADNAFSGLTSKPLYVHATAQTNYANDSYWDDFTDVNTMTTSNFVYAGFTFSLNNEQTEATVTGHTLGAMRYTYDELSIPHHAIYDNKTIPVTIVGKEAFKGYKSPKKIRLPEPIYPQDDKDDSGFAIPTTIEKSAFEGCSGVTELNNVYIVKTIGASAFRLCTALRDGIDLNYIESIGDEAFNGCVSLRGVNISSPYLIYIGESAFDGCSDLQTLVIGSATTPYYSQQHLVIGDDAFNGCTNIGNRNYNPNREFDFECNLDLGSMNITHIGDNAFKGCAYIERVILGEQIEYIGQSAFQDCTRLKIMKEEDDDDKEGSVIYDLDLNLPRLTHVGKKAFYDCGFTGSLILGDRLTNGEVGTQAFSNIPFTGDLIIGNGWTYLPYNMFNSGFTGKLILGNRLTEVPAGYFDGFEFTGELVVGQNITSIGNNAFYDATFSQITSYAEVAPSLGNDAFHSMVKTNNVYVPQCSVASYTSTWGAGADGFTNISTHNSLKDSDFYFEVTDAANRKAKITHLQYGASEATTADLVIPETVTGCDDNIYTVTAIDDNAFNGCSGYTGGLVIPNTVETIGSLAFAYGGFTGQLKLPKNLTTIGELAFLDCNGFTGDLNIPIGVTNVAAGAFMYNTGMNGRLVLPNTLTTIGEFAFGGSSLTGNVFIPNSVENIGSFAFALCDDLNVEMVLSNRLETVKTWMASGTQFTKVILGSSVEKIEQLAFTPINLQAMEAEKERDILGDLTIETLVSLAPTPPEFIVDDDDDHKGKEMPEPFNRFNGLKGMRGDEPEQLNPEDYALMFFGITLETPVYVPCEYEDAYNNDPIWGEFNINNRKNSHINGLPRFLGTVNNLWSVSGNWCAECGTPSATNDYAIIEADCVINENETITVGNLFVTEGCTVTVKSGAKLIAPHIFTDKGSIDGCIVVEDGGQLIHDIENVNASVQREIAAHGATISDGGWNFIASPLVTDYEPTASNELLGDHPYTYDLYYYDETAHYWRNFQDDIANVGQEMNQDPGFKLNNGQGYLYANEDNATIRFNGTVTPSARPIATSLSYTEYINESANVLAGWNLVGNPFTCDATIGQSYYRIGDGANTVACLDDENIKPCEGVMVVANSSNQDVTFTRVTSSSGGGRTNCLRVNVAHTMMHRGNTKSMVEDNAIISFYEKDRLPKFVFNADVAKLYIPQDGKEYAIAVSDWQNEMPLNFKAAANGNYTISVIPDGLNLKYLHLIDNMTGDDTDLLANPSYSFDAKVSDYESRFRLVFDTDDNDDNASTETTTFAYYNGSEWVIDNTGEAILQVVDVMGRVLRNEQIDGNAHIDLGSLTPAVYMMRLVNGENVKTQKIVVK